MRPKMVLKRKLLNLKQNSPAKVNVAILHAASVGNTMALLPVVARLLFGPFPVPVVLVIYYLFRVIIIFAVSILTIKMVLMSAFLVDFELMTGKNFSC